MTASSAAGPSLRWTPLSFLLFATGAALIAVGAALRTPVPLFLAVPLLLGAPAAAFGGPRGPVRVAVSREVRGSGRDVVLEQRVLLQDRGDARDLDLAAPDLPGLRPVAPPSIRRTEAALEGTARWTADEPTVLEVPPPEIVWRDAAGLVERAADFEVVPLLVERYPPEVLRVGAVRLHRTVALPGETRSSRIGSSGEFFGLRGARPNEPSRRINWRASARAGRLLANDYLLDRAGDILLFLDARGTPLGPRLDTQLLGTSRAAAAGIAESFLREKARVGLAVFAEFVEAVPLSSGRNHRHQLRARLLAARLGPEGVPAERGAIAASRYFPPGTTTILLSSLENESTGELVVHLRRRGYPVVVLSPSPLPLLGDSGPHDRSEDVAIVDRIVRLARRCQIVQSWREAPTIDWSDHWSLEGLVDFLRRPATRRLG